jgi:hypothetical protein
MIGLGLAHFAEARAGAVPQMLSVGAAPQDSKVRQTEMQ